MGNFFSFSKIFFGNIDEAYELLLQSTTILPDCICMSLITNNDPRLLNMLKNSNYNYGNYNETSIGNFLAIMRGFPNNDEYLELCEVSLRGWLKYMFCKIDNHFFANFEILQVLHCLNK